MPWPIWNAFVLASRITWTTLCWGKAVCWAGGGGSMLIMCWRHFCRVAACAGRCMIEKWEHLELWPDLPGVFWPQHSRSGRTVSALDVSLWSGEERNPEIIFALVEVFTFLMVGRRNCVSGVCCHNFLFSACIEKMKALPSVSVCSRSSLDMAWHELTGTEDFFPKAVSSAAWCSVESVTLLRWRLTFFISPTLVYCLALSLFSLPAAFSIFDRLV